MSPGKLKKDSGADKRVRFDIAWALAAVTKAKSIYRSFPAKLSLDEASEKILSDCIDPTSWTSKGCKFRKTIIDTGSYQLEIGSDVLCPFPEGRVFVGGSGITVQLFDESLRRSFAFKVPRVSVFAYSPKEFADLDVNNFRPRFAAEHGSFDNERQISRRLSHANIARAIYGDYKLVDTHEAGLPIEFPYSVSEWIDGAQHFSEYVLDRRLRITQILPLIIDGLSALSHIHKQDVVHWDLKSDNILISRDGVLKVIDFGNAKQIDKPESLQLLATTTKGKYPPITGFRASPSGFDESRRLNIVLPHVSWHHQYIDLWMYAQEWN